MDDFLHNLRTGKLKRDGRDYNRYRGNSNNGYSGQQYKGPQRRNGQDRRNTAQTSLREHECIPEILKALEMVCKNQTRIADADEKLASFEKRKVDSMEHIEGYLKQVAEFISNISNVTTGKEQKNPATETARNLTGMASKKAPHDTGQMFKIIHNMRSSGNSYTKIADYLIEKRIPTLSGKGKWYPGTVSNILKKETAL